VYVDLSDLEHNYLLVRARPHSPSEADRLTLYEFWYWLYGSYIYDRVEKTEHRPELHLRVAQCLAALYADDPRVAGVLAEHFVRGGRPLEAATHALVAAKLEASQSAWATVEHWCRSGLKWLEAIEGQEAAQARLDLLHELAQGYYRNGDYHSATETFQKAIDQAELANAEPHLVARLWVYLSEGEEAQGDYPSARRALRQGQAFVHKHHLPPSEVTLWLSTMEGLLLCRADKGERAVAVLQKIIEDGGSLPDGVFSDFVRMRTYNCLGIALIDKSDKTRTMEA
jgi:tetratricopeptide (TPR) repeat protein